MLYAVKNRAVHLKQLENLQSDLLQYEDMCAFTNILLPLTENTEHDYCYYYKSTDTLNNNITTAQYHHPYQKAYRIATMRKKVCQHT